jgi:hypothetical protein
MGTNEHPAAGLTVGWTSRLSTYLKLGSEQLEKICPANTLPAMPDPITTIVADIVARLEERAFQPFVITLSDGARFEIATRDHCTVTRLLRRVEIEHDNGSITHINPLHITKLELRKPAA